MGPIFNVIRKSVGTFFEEAFLLYLNMNPSVDDFKKVKWNSSRILFR